MRQLVCPTCGQRYKDDGGTRFCDTDGAALKAAADVSPLVASTKAAGSAPPWGLVMAVAGVVCLAVAAWIFMASDGPRATSTVGSPASKHRKARTDPEDSHSAAAGSDSSQPTGNTENDDHRGQSGNDSTKEAASAGASLAVGSALIQCYGEAPAIPKSAKGADGQTFESTKDGARELRGTVADLAGGRAMTIDEERQAGDEAIKKVEHEYRRSKDSTLAGRITKIGKALAAHGTRRNEMSYSFTLLETKEVNAFMLPGGRGYVLSGLAHLLTNDDELAVVLGHELAHADLKHHDAGLRISSAGRSLGGLLGGIGGGHLGELGASIGAGLLSMTFDQGQEFEADRLGLCIAAMAGFEPEAAARGFKKLASKQADEPPSPKDGPGRIAYDIISTHPPTEDRVRYFDHLTKLYRQHQGR